MDKYINYIEAYNQFEENLIILKNKIDTHQTDFNHKPTWNHLHDIEVVNKHLQLLIDII